MLIALIAGIVTFILTIIGIPAFIRFTIRLVSQANRCTKMSSSIRPRPEHQPWVAHCLSLDIPFWPAFVIGLFSHQLSNGLIMILFILVLYGVVGFLDDFLKVSM